MSNARSNLALALAVVLATACGAGKPTATARSTPSAPAITPSVTAISTPSDPTTPTAPTVSAPPTPTAAQCSAAQPAPQFAPSPPSNRNLALVWLSGGTSFVVRDVTDINRPSTVNTLPGLGSPQFVGPTDISFATETELVRIPLSGTPRTTVATLCRGVIGFAWSPDGTTAAYVTDLQYSGKSALHIVSAGFDRTISSMPSFPWGTGCESRDCADNLDARLVYSPNGANISLVQNWSGPNLYIWKSTGELLKGVDSNSRGDSSAPTMSAWSGTGLYFRDGNGVELWRDGALSLVLPGVAWIRPKASPGGGQIVFEARDAYGQPSVFMLDTAAGVSRLLTKLRSEPAFLTSRYLWYRGERPCAPGDPYPCGAGASTISTGKTYIYDLQTGSEVESIITWVWDTWPHPV